MIRTITRKVLIEGPTYVELSGLSTEDKPEDTFIATGSMFLEADTGDVYLYNEEGSTGSKWVKVGG